MNRIAASTLAIAAASLSALGTPALAGVELLSHRANYELRLHEASQNSGMAGVHGLLVMENREACEGFITNQELAFVAELTAGLSINYSFRFSSWESPDLNEMRFTVKSFDNGNLSDEFEGSARRGDGLPSVDYAKPEGIAIDLPVGTIFPTEHMQQLVQSAIDNKMVMNSEVFDGSGPDNLTSVTAIIGRSQSVAADGGAVQDETSWPVSLAYYPVQGPSDLPEFEISFNITPEGVLHDIILDYGDFAMAAELIDIERFAKPECS